MLTMREPLVLKAARTIALLSPAFQEKIEANYDTAANPVNREELLHIMMQAPQIQIQEGGRFQITQSQTDNRKSVTIWTVNQMLNRLLLWNENHFTYQDQVYIERQLRRMGIREVSSFLKQVREVCGDCQEIHRLTNQYESIGRVFREAGVSLGKLRAVTARGEKETGADKQMIPLYREIYRRLDTRRIYRELRCFHQNQFGGNRVDETCRFAEYERTELELACSEAGTAAMERVQGIPERVNPYELAEQTAGGGVSGNAVEQMKSRMVSAVFLNLAEQTYAQRLEMQADVRREWTDFRFAIQETVANTLKRFENYHLEGRRLVERVKSYQREIRALRRDEEMFLTRLESLVDSSKRPESGIETVRETLLKSMELLLDVRDGGESGPGINGKEPANHQESGMEFPALVEKRLVDEASAGVHELAAVRETPESGIWENGAVIKELTAAQRPEEKTASESPLELTFLREEKGVEDHWEAAGIPGEPGADSSVQAVRIEESSVELPGQIAAVIEQVERIAGRWENMTVFRPTWEAETDGDIKEVRTQAWKENPPSGNQFLQAKAKEESSESTPIPAVDMKLLEDNPRLAGEKSASETPEQKQAHQTLESQMAQLAREVMNRKEQQKILLERQTEKQPSGTSMASRTGETKNAGEVFGTRHGETLFQVEDGRNRENEGGTQPEALAEPGKMVTPLELELAKAAAQNEDMFPQEMWERDGKAREIEKYIRKIMGPAAPEPLGYSQKRLLKTVETAGAAGTVKIVGLAGDTLKRPDHLEHQSPPVGGIPKKIPAPFDKIGEQTGAGYQEVTEKQLLKTVESQTERIDLEFARDGAGSVYISSQEPSRTIEHEQEIKQYLDKINEQNVRRYRELSEKSIERPTGPVKKMPDMERMRREAKLALTDPEKMISGFYLSQSSREEPGDEKDRERQRLEVILRQADDTTRYIYEQIWNYGEGNGAGQAASSVRPVTPIQLVTDINRVMEEKQSRMLLTDREYGAEPGTAAFVMGAVADRAAMLQPPGNTAKGGETLEVPAASMIYKQMPPPVNEELLEQLVQKQEVQVKKEVTTSISESVIRQQAEVVKQAETMKNHSAQELQELIEKGITRQMGTISEKVYHRLEKRLEHERARRGR